MNNQTPSVPTEEIVDLSPFKRMVMTIGTLPTAFTESMTYYEALAYFAKYLEETVIPAVNQNAEATEELQTLFTELKSYVDNYFDNLDVQDEINAKLDAMVEDGTMATIINQEIFGELNTAVANNTTAIAGLNGRVSSAEASITSLDSAISVDEANDTIIIGDSYIAGEWYEGGLDWGNQLAGLMGLTVGTNCFIAAASGSGFVREGSGGATFGTLLSGLSSTITDHNKIKNIIVCGGLNDVNADSQSEIQTAISNFITSAKSSYPNATVYVGMIGWNAGSSNAVLRDNVNTMVLPAYQACSGYGGVYLNGVEFILHYYSFLGTSGATDAPDGSHPTTIGQRFLSRGIYEALKGGYTNLTVSESSISLAGSTCKLNIKNNQLEMRFQGNANLGLSSDATSGAKTVDLGELPNAFLRSVGDKSYTTMSMMIKYSDNSWVVQPVRLNVDNQHHLILNFYSTKALAVTGASWVIENKLLPLLEW